MKSPVMKKRREAAVQVSECLQRLKTDLKQGAATKRTADSDDEQADGEEGVKKRAVEWSEVTFGRTVGVMKSLMRETIARLDEAAESSAARDSSVEDGVIDEMMNFSRDDHPETDRSPLVRGMGHLKKQLWATGCAPL